MDSTEWHYDAVNRVYLHPASATYAVQDLAGQWTFHPASDFTLGESSRSRPTPAPADDHGDKEEGEVEDDVGWGGLMEPEQVEKVLKAKRHQAPTPFDRGSTFTTNAPDEWTREAEDADGKEKTRVLRLVVESSDVLSTGDVAIVDTRQGGVQLGRDRCEKGAPARVRLKEMPVSKTHAVVYFGDGGEWQDAWFVVDLGSTHGTFVDDCRLSEPKHSSKPGKLVHGSKITIGSTTLVAHIHEAWPCSACQISKDNEIRLDDGEASKPSSMAKPVEDALDIRRGAPGPRGQSALAALKQSLLKPAPNGARGWEQSPERTYLDRSALRRAMHPPSPSRRRSLSPASRNTTPQPVAPSGPSSFASGMLAAQGWTPGSGLGKDRQGRATPVNVEMRTERRGLGAAGSKAVVDDGPGDWRDRGKARRFESMHTK